MSVNRFLAAASVLYLLSVTAGCTKESAGTPQSALSANADPLTNDECSDFIQRFEAAVASHNESQLLGMINVGAIVEGATAGFEIAAEERSRFRSNIEGLLVAESGLIGSLTKSEHGSVAKFLRRKKRESETWLLFRLLTADGTLQYAELQLGRGNEGITCAVDLINFTSDQSMVETARLEVVKLIKKRSDPNASATPADTFLPLINRSFRESRHEDVILYVDLMSKSEKPRKSLLMLKVFAAANLDEDKYVAAVEEFRKHFPHDPALDLISMQAHLNAKRYSEAIACLDRLEIAIQGDPYLDVLRSSWYFLMGNVSAADNAIKRAMAALPDMPDPFWAHVRFAALSGDHDATVERLVVFDKKFKDANERLSNDADFDSIRTSPQYAAWREKQNEK